MEIEVRKLREALELLKPVVPKKATLAVIRNVLLDDGHLRGTDLEVMVDIKVVPPNGERFILPPLELADLLKRIDGHDVLTITGAKRTLHLSWSDGKASFDVEADPEDFPPSANIEPTVMGTIDGSRLIPALAAVAPYAATESSRPVLNGVEIALGEKIKVGAADGFRLAYLELPIALPNGAPVPEGMSGVILPQQAVTVLDHLNRKAPRVAPKVGTLAEMVTTKRIMDLVMSKTALRLGFGDVTFTTILVQGQFPSYMQLIPKETPVKVNFMAGDLERVIRSIREKDTPLRMQWTTDKMTVAANGIEMNITAMSETPGRTAINTKFMLEYLSGKESLVEMRLMADDRSGPVVLAHGSSPFVLIMPMQVQWGDETATVVPEPEASVAEGDNTGEEEESGENENAVHPESGLEAESEAPSANEPETVTAAEPKLKKSRKKKPAKV